MPLSQLSSLSPAPAARVLLVHRCQAPSVSRLVATPAPVAPQRSLMLRSYQLEGMLPRVGSAVSRDDKQRLAAAIDAVWPANSNASVHRASRVAALHLLAAPNYRDTKSKVANAIALHAHTFKTHKSEAVQAFKQDLPGNSLTVFLQDDAFFQLTPGGSTSSGGIVTLDVRTLLAAAAGKVAAQTSASNSLSLGYSSEELEVLRGWGMIPRVVDPTPDPILATDSGRAVQQPANVTTEQLLSFIEQQHCWHATNSHLAVVRKALAAHLVTAANDGPSSDVVASDTELYTIHTCKAGPVMLEALKKECAWTSDQPRPYSRIDEALAGDPFLQLLEEETADGFRISTDIVQMDIKAVLRAAAAAAKLWDRQQHKLLSYVRNRLWHDDQQLAVARQTVAEHILTSVHHKYPGLSVDSARYCMTGQIAGSLIRDALQRKLGWTAEDPTSFNGMFSAMSGDPYLSTYYSKPSELSIKLDVAALLTDADAATEQDTHEQILMSDTIHAPSNVDSTTALVEPDQELHQLSKHDWALDQQPAASGAAAISRAVMPASNRRSLFGEQRSPAAVPGNESLESLLELQHHEGGWYLPVYSTHSSTGSGASSEDHIKLDDADDMVDTFAASITTLLPDSLQHALQDYISTAADGPTLEEIMADAGHPVQIKLSDHTVVELPVTLDIQDALRRLAAAKEGLEEGTNSSSSSSSLFDSVLAGFQTTTGSSYDGMFGSDNRMGIPGTLHRISAMRDRKKGVIGLTYRVGRHVPGVALMIADVLSSMKASIRSLQTDRPQSLLLLGRPGVGKTTLLRDIARILSLPVSEGGLGLAVVVVDTSNEIAGDATQRHPCIGRARRMMVPSRDQQAAVLVEAVQNHGPDVIIVDEIGTEQEVRAARTIAQRGVLLVGTAHGGALGNLLKNPELRSLIGGVQSVTVGDATAQATNFGQKTKLERVGAATFVTLLELQQKNRWQLHLDVEQSVDILLGAPQGTSAGSRPVSESLSMTESLKVNTQSRSRLKGSEQYQVVFETAAAAEQAAAAAADLSRAAGGNGDAVVAGL